MRSGSVAKALALGVISIEIAAGFVDVIAQLPPLFRTHATRAIAAD